MAHSSRSIAPLRSLRANEWHCLIWTIPSSNSANISLSVQGYAFLTTGEFQKVSLLYPNAQQHIQSLIRNGWAVVILTNQGGVGMGICTIEEMKATRLDSV